MVPACIKYGLLLPDIRETRERDLRLEQRSGDGLESLKHCHLRGDKFGKKVKKTWSKDEKQNYSN